MAIATAERGGISHGDSLNGVNRDNGSGTPNELVAAKDFLLIPGWMQTVDTMRPLGEQIEDARDTEGGRLDYRVHYVKGKGNALDVLTDIENQTGVPAAVIGHSEGGTFGGELHQIHPDKVHHSVAVSSILTGIRLPQGELGTTIYDPNEWLATPTWLFGVVTQNRTYRREYHVRHSDPTSAHFAIIQNEKVGEIIIAEAKIALPKRTPQRMQSGKAVLLHG